MSRETLTELRDLLERAPGELVGLVDGLGGELEAQACGDEQYHLAGDVLVLDVDAAAEYLRGRSEVDPARMLSAGTSRGWATP